MERQELGFNINQHWNACLMEYFCLIECDSSSFSMYRLRSLSLVKCDSESNALPVPLCFGILVRHCNHRWLMEALVFYEGMPNHMCSCWNMKHRKEGSDFTHLWHINSVIRIHLITVLDCPCATRGVSWQCHWPGASPPSRPRLEMQIQMQTKFRQRTALNTADSCHVSYAVDRSGLFFFPTAPPKNNVPARENAQVGINSK